MIFMSSDGAGLIAHAYHAYHAAAAPEELSLEAWTVDCGFWLDKKIAPRQGEGHALLNISRRRDVILSHKHAIAAQD